MSNAPPRPTHIRHLVIGVTTLSSLLLYLDRVCISMAGTYIQQDLGLSDDQIGWVMGLFFWSYALGQVPSGWLTDRFGARRMLTAYILSWSLLTACTGLAFGLYALVAIRLGFGLAQAGAYPTSASVVSKWAPFSARGVASGIVAVGGRVGGAIAPFLTGYLIVAFTPMSTPIDLQGADLMDAPRLCFLMDGGAEPASTSKQPVETNPAATVGPDLLARFSDTGKQVVRRLAKDYRLEHKPPKVEKDQKQRGKADAQRLEKARPAPPAPSADDLRALADELNAALEDPAVFPATAYKPATLPSEARGLLLQRKDGELSAREGKRLNRLLLETAFPKSVRQLYVAGWRWVMFAYGAIGLLVAGVFWSIMRDRPAKHPRCNEAEVDMIEYGRPPGATSNAGRVGNVPIKSLLTSRSLWLSCISQCGTNVGWIFIISWLPFYLERELRVPIEQRGFMSSVPLVVGWFGMLLGGRVTDRLVRRLGVRWGRALPMTATRFLAMMGYIGLLSLAPGPSEAWLAVAAFSLVAFATDLGTPAVWAFMQDAGGRYVGSVLGWGNMWGNLGAGVAVPALKWIVGDDDNWAAAFIACAVAFFISGVAALAIDATQPIVPEEEE